jgi:7-cyano-7-deazaguanine synthase
MTKAVVLLSGGLDSATCLAWARREGFEGHALTVDYGQRHAIEIARAAEIARALGAASHRVVAIDLSHLAGSALTDPRVEVPKVPTEGIPVTYVPARNALFLALALGWAESLGSQDLVVGVNAVDYSGYPDCRPSFLRAFEAMAREGTKAGAEGRACRVHAPLVDLKKSEILRRAIAWGVPVDRTGSCYDPAPDGTACESCDACRLRAAALAEVEIPRP